MRFEELFVEMSTKQLIWENCNKYIITLHYSTDNNMNCILIMIHSNSAMLY